jgi:CRISPR/Cas system CSM-associated protein Csm3 (group 7 of RAMP superfamily)
VDFGDIDTYPMAIEALNMLLRVITKLPNSEQSYKGKVKTHNYINRQIQSTRSLCPLHAIRRNQVFNSLHIINNNNNHENVKYTATNIVNKMTIVEDMNGFGKKRFKTLFTLYMSEFRHMP